MVKTLHLYRIEWIAISDPKIAAEVVSTPQRAEVVGISVITLTADTQMTTIIAIPTLGYLVMIEGMTIQEMVEVVMTAITPVEDIKMTLKTAVILIVEGSFLSIL